MFKLIFGGLLALLFACYMSVATAQGLPLSGVAAGSEPAQTNAQAEETPPQSDSTISGELRALVGVLQDETARQTLIDALDQAMAATTGEAAPTQSQDPATGTTAASEADPGTEGDPTADGGAASNAVVPIPKLTSEELQGIAQQAALKMTTFANDVRARAEDLLVDLRRVSSIPEVLSDARRQRIMSEGPRLLLTILATVAIYRVLRIAARVVVAKPRDRSLAQIGRAIALQSSMRLIGLVLAWVAGYALASAFGGGEVALVQAYYLNAFLIVGAFTAILSLLVSYSEQDVTFSQMPLEIDATIFRSIKRFAGLLIYTMVAVVPTAKIWTSFTIANSLRSVLLTLALIMGLVYIRRVRRAMHEWLAVQREGEEQAAEIEGDSGDEDVLTSYVVNTTEALWNRVWPPLAALYLLVCYWIAITRPYNMLDILGQATLHSVGALVIFLLSLRLLTRAGSMAIPVPDWKGRLLPLFVERCNGFLSTLSIFAGLVGVILSVVWGLSAWDLFNVGAWIEWDKLWGLVTALMILLVALLIWAGISAWIDDRLTTTLPGRVVSARSRTLLSLARNAFTIAVIVFGGMMALAELGINIAPLIAGAGVIGLAIGFGAQKLVQDIITGVFIQLENAINEGDVVTVAGITGSVESLTIRSVGIRDLTGTYHLVPFSAVDTVSNFMRRFAYHVEVVGIGYGSDIDTAREAMFEAYEIVKKGQFGEFILADLEMHGVVGLGDSSVNIRARIRTMPGKQWDVGRAYTEQVKKVFDMRGIEIPFPHRELKMPDQLFERMKALADRGPAVIQPPKQDAPQIDQARTEPGPLGAGAGPTRGEGPGGDDE